MKKLSILSKSFISMVSTTKFFFATRSFDSTFEHFFGHNRPGIRVFESLLDSQRESALFVDPDESLFAHFLSCVSEFLERSKLVSQMEQPRVSPFHHDWRTTTDRTASLLLESDRLVFGTHQRAPCRWWRHRRRSHWGPLLHRGFQGVVFISLRDVVLVWAHNLWEARTRPGCQGPQRKCTGNLSTTSWKMKLTGRRKDRVSREKTVGKEKWMELSKRRQSNTTLTWNMRRDEWVRTQNLSHACACNSLWKMDVWGVVFTPPVGCSRLLSAVDDLTATNLKKILKVDTSEVLWKDGTHNGSPRSIMSLFTWAQLWTFMLIVMSSTRTLSIATKCWRKNMMIGAIAGISRMELPWVVVLQILGEDGLMWSTHRWSQNDLSPVRFFQTYWEIHQFCIENTLILSGNERNLNGTTEAREFVLLSSFTSFPISVCHEVVPS